MLSNRLKSLRTHRNITQSDLAKRIGVARTTYAMYEQGQREPDYDTLQKIADFYDVSTDYLLGRTDQLENHYTKSLASENENLSAYQQEVLEFFMSREDLFFKDKPENILDALEQFEIYYELYKKQQEKKK